MRQAQIFISYRRDDTAGYARAVYDELARQFGADRVFIDVDDIGAGQPFDEVIERAVGESKVLVVMIGKRWLGERDGQPPRIGEAGDFVRREVAAALAKGMRVIPVLLDRAAMPTEAQLPNELRPLARRNALEVDNTRFATDIERLVGALREALGEPAAAAATAPTPAPAMAQPRPRGALMWAMAAVAAVVALAFLWQWRAPPRGGQPTAQGQPESAGSSPTASIATRPDVNGEWQAVVDYDWPNAHYTERFVFLGADGDLQGSASFLGVARGVLEGRIDADGLRFITRTSEVGGAAGSPAETVHRYRGRWDGGELRFVMQTEGGSSAHGPVEFVARRVAKAASR
jgi:hypothetical protein